MIIRFNVLNSFGKFTSEDLNVSKEEYDDIMQMSKTFWLSNEGFNMWTKEGSSITFPPNIICNSILIVDVIEE